VDLRAQRVETSRESLQTECGSDIGTGQQVDALGDDKRPVANGGRVSTAEGQRVLAAQLHGLQTRAGESLTRRHPCTVELHLTETDERQCQMCEG
jgi:hypothetical protein